MTYNLAAGADEAALNAIAASFYGAFRGVFRISLPIRSDQLTRVDIDFQVAPSLSLVAALPALERARSFASTLPKADRAKALAHFTDKMMTASCSQVSITFDIPNAPVTVICALSFGASVAFDHNNAFTLVLSDASITLPGNPLLATLFSDLVAFILVDYLNATIFSQIRIPMLPFFGATVPQVTTEIAPDTNNDKMLVAYDAFQPFKLPAPGTPWPEATAFIGIDAVAINYVANRNMPSPSGSGGCEVPNLSWDYALTLSPLVTISPGGGNRIEMTVNASGSASVTWHTPGILPNVSFSVSVAGSAAALGQISVDPDGANQDVNLRIVGAGQFDLSANLDGVPTGLIPGLDAGIDALLDMMSAAAVAILEDHVFTVYSLAPIRFDLLGNPGMLAPRKFTLNQSTGDGVPLVVVTGHPVFMAAT